MSTSGEKVIWFVIGAAIGAGIALLYAPKTGRDTRRYIRRRAEDAKDAISKTAEDARDVVVETGSNVFEKGRGLYRKGEHVVNEAADLLERGRKVMGV